MEATDELKAEVRDLLITNLMLQDAAESLGDDTPLFGPDGMGLDSVDALQIVVALDKHYGLKISDADAARQVLASIDTIAAAIAESSAATPAEGL
ncbi:MAG: acyl carrier protein [Verrucomicrobiales bacterium]|nr:acyl carrier protein [Verrucomicrobiales bacterium]MCP5528603.1 acyl carrier protein [Verrucomicrobiales bacterium]